MNDDAERFLDICRAWRSLVEQSHQLPLAQRLEALAGHVAHIYAAGLRLPATDVWREQAPDLPDWPHTWPGVGGLDRANPSLTVLLRGLSADLDRGVVVWENDGPEHALRWWRAQFDERWGTLALACLERLHGGLRSVRLAARDAAPPLESNTSDEAVISAPPADLGPRVVPEPRASPPADRGVVARAGGVVLPSFEPLPPTRLSSGRQRPRVERGVLGIRFEVVTDGAVVRAVHPAGPATGELQAGDLLRSVAGVSLQGRSQAEVGVLISGAIGEVQRFDVERDGERFAVRLAAVSADELVARPLELQLLVLDRDAAGLLLGSLADRGVVATPDPDQEGLLRVCAPASLSALLRATLDGGAEQGLWEIL
ncbi:MAG: hypothetical protein ACI9MC_004076 [Kiritimatiellia bacterium]|jgi:hypothetical protein